MKLEELKSMTIGGIEYQVEFDDTLVKYQDLLGQVRFNHPNIKVDNTISDEKKKEVIVHEMIHAIFESAGYDDESEEMVRRLTRPLYLTLRDNDFSWIKNDKKE